MKGKRIVISLIAATAFIATTAVFFTACSGGGSGSGNTSSSVALYATNSLSNSQQAGTVVDSTTLKPKEDISEYQQVIATITKVTVLNTGSGASCDILTTATTPSTPITVNIANLSGVLQLLNLTSCPAVPYNRLHVELERSVDLMNSAGATSACSFGSYKDSASKVNTLQCTGALCTLDINGAVNVLAGQQNGLALDLNLKDFDVENFGDPLLCSVTMKVSPIHGDGLKYLWLPTSFTGIGSGLTTSTQTFTLSKKLMSFSVSYSGITPSLQPGLDDLLLRAQQDLLRTRVTASTIDYAGSTIDASKIAVKVEGLVSGLTATGFTLTYQMTKTMDVDTSKALVKGALADGAWAEVKLYGYDIASSTFLASMVEVEYACTVPDYLKKEKKTVD